MNIVSALHASEGICCAVGAGGKKTTIYSLAQRVERAVVTATVRIPPFSSSVEDLIVTDDPRSAIESATAWPLGLSPVREGPDRFGGYEPSIINELSESSADAIFVKADGARMRNFKAPADHEPRIPTAATTVIPIVSAHVVGEPLTDEVVHRVERVAAIADLDPGDTITTAAVGRVIASKRGGMKGVPPKATVVPLVNMIDDEALRQVGIEIAETIHRHVDVPRVVLATMRESRPLVDIV